MPKIDLLPCRSSMTKTEKLLAVAFSIVSGIAIAYIQKSKQLERLNDAQAETISELRDYIEWTESDFGEVHGRTDGRMID